MPDVFPILMPAHRMEIVRRDLRAAGVCSMVVCVPWSLMAPHEARAQRNHGGQSLARLAERGGLSACEALAVIEDRSWRGMPTPEAHRQLAAKLASDSKPKGE